MRYCDYVGCTDEATHRVKGPGQVAMEACSAHLATVVDIIIDNDAPYVSITRLNKSPKYQGIDAGRVVGGE